MSVNRSGILIAAAFALSLGLPAATGWAQTLGPASTSLSGAGATFPAPLYKKWISVYQALASKRVDHL
jgi:ABC-type phosphate transport system substrate-binding protein